MRKTTRGIVSIWIWALLLSGFIGARSVRAAAPSGNDSPVDESGDRPQATVLILPYLALGGEGDTLHFITGLTLRNSQAVAESVSVEIFDDEWQPLPVILNGNSEMSGKTTWTIPPD